MDLVLWSLFLFLLSFLIGFVAVIGGVGGSVLFVPIVSSFFDFNLDFVRATGLILGLTTSLSSSPKLLEEGIASIRLSLPFSLTASLFSILGAQVGLVVDKNLIRVLLGLSIILASLLLFFSKSSEFPPKRECDFLASLLKLKGSYYDSFLGKEVEWCAGRSLLALLFFSLVGFMAGLFGLGAGWANLPLYNLLMGVPLKVSIGSSLLTLSITTSSALWVYLKKGALLPILTVPSIFGIFLGSKLGARLLIKIKPKRAKLIGVSLLLLAGLRSLLKGIGI